MEIHEQIPVGLNSPLNSPFETSKFDLRFPAHTLHHTQVQRLQYAIIAQMTLDMIRLYSSSDMNSPYLLFINGSAT